MSLYVLCRLCCDASERQRLFDEIVRKGDSLGIGIQQNGFEEEDNAILAQYDQFRDQSVDMSITDSGDKCDATALWNEAMITAREVLARAGCSNTSSIGYAQAKALVLPNDYKRIVGETRLGLACQYLIGHPRVFAGTIALIEGGIEQVVCAPAANCLQQILRFLLVPWDCGPNAAYVWGKEKVSGTEKTG